MTLIHELVKALNLYASARVDQQSNLSRNSNSKFASKKCGCKRLKSLLNFVLVIVC